MIKILKYSTYLLSAVFVACSAPQEENIDYVLFSGTILNPNDDVAAVSGNGYNAEFLLDESASFSDTIFISEPGYFQFATGRESSRMYLNPGDVLEVKLNTEEFDETINYSGKGAEKNNYLAKKYLESETSAPGFEEFFSLNEEEFSALNNQLFSAESDLLMASQIPDEAFIEVEKKAIKYDYLSNISNYKEYHIYVTKDADFQTSDGFNEKLSDFDYNNIEDYRTYGSYRTIVANHYIQSIETKEELESTFSAINEISNEEIRNDLLTKFKYSFSPAHSELELFYTLLMETSTDTAFEASITKKYNLIKNLTPGNVSPGFTYPDRNGNDVSLADLKGKYVYIDVWATWCGPCKREIPHLKALTEEYNGKDIEFVSISIDEQKDYEKWQAMLNEKEMEGVQLFSDNDWSSTFVKEYGIQGIPRFILVDKEGIIISADAARPSDPALKEILQELL